MTQPQLFLAAILLLLSPLARAREAVDNSNDFSFYFSQQVPATGNAIYSPWSIREAFSLLYGGAEGATARSLQDTFRFAVDKDEVGAELQGLRSGWNAADSSYKLSTSNRVWLNPSMPVNDNYAHYVRHWYGEALAELAPASVINAWIEQQTQHKITHLIPAEAVTPETVMILTNAIYFQAAWNSPFRKDNTRPEIFNGDQPVQIPMMHQTHTFYYHKGGDYAALELPYLNKALSLIVVLPDNKSAWADVRARFMTGAWNELRAALRPQRVQVTLPPFHFVQQLDLTKTLRGLSHVFRQADFRGITPSPAQVDQAVHKAFIKLDEDGTEAAAATGVMFALSSVMPSAPPIEFRADHPFIFFIQDHRTGLILFAGHFSEPAND